MITVPAYFGIREREATQQAARIAGIDVLDLVAEPVAAAIAYGVDTAIGENVLVYDLGGGTFDTTVISMDVTGPRVISTDGAHDLGGAQWDERLMSHLIDAWAESAGPEGDPYSDDAFVAQVAGHAEELKKSLSTRNEVTVQLTFEGRRAPITVSRATFEQITEDLLARTLDISDRTIASAKGAGVTGIARIVLVGGSSRMPAVARVLTGHYGVEALLADPDFAVSKGAAMRAAFLDTRAVGAARALPDVPGRAPTGGLTIGRGDSHGAVPRSVGVLIWDSFDLSGERRIVDHVIHRNSSLPIEAAVTYGTVLDGQDRVRVQVYEQAGAVESEELDHNRPVLDGLITEIPPLPAGSPIRVTLAIGDDGRLRVIAEEPASKARLQLDSFIEGVTDSEDVGRLTKLVSGLSVIDRG